MMGNAVKKVFMIAVVIMLLAAPQAFATTGIGDTQATAVEIINNGGTVTQLQYIDSSNDVDWYKWTNNTGRSVSYTANLYSPFGLNYDLGGIIVFSNGFTIPLPVVNQGPGQVETSGGANISPGTTVYFRIMGNGYSDYSTSDRYIFELTVN